MEDRGNLGLEDGDIFVLFYSVIGQTHHNINMRSTPVLSSLTLCSILFFFFSSLALDTSPCLCQVKAHDSAPPPSLPTPSSSSRRILRLLCWMVLRFSLFCLHRLYRSLTRLSILFRSALAPRLPKTLSQSPTSSSQSRVLPPRPLLSIPIISVSSLLLTPLSLFSPPFHSPQLLPINL